MRCILLRGAGRAFSAGGDLAGNPPRESAADHLRFYDAADELNARLRCSPLPVVAAVHGYCLGAALGLAAGCDIVIAAESTRLGVPEGRLGLPGGARLAPLIGRQWAKFLIFTGELLSAAQARDIGLVTFVLPDAGYLDGSRDLARRLARMPRDAIALNKRAVDAVADASGDAAAFAAAAGYDTVTLTMAPNAQAPDGRTFGEIRREEGVQGLESARAGQYSRSWLAWLTATGADGRTPED